MVEVDHPVVAVGGPYADGSYVVTCKGKIVPHITVHEGLAGIGVPSTYADEEAFVVVLVDDRMGWWVRRDALAQTLELLANAMSVAAGFACWLGPRLDPFGNPPNYSALSGPIGVVK